MLDTSVFKRLAHNDTGKAPGHQGGVLIPAGIAMFFPPLPRLDPTAGPTIDIKLKAELVVDGKRVGLVDVRYQYQTWGGTRSPERRLTENLAPLRDEASKDDILLFTRDLEDEKYIQLYLVRKGTEEYRRLNARLGAGRWGPIDPGNPPVSIQQMSEAKEYIEGKAADPPNAFDTSRTSAETVTMRRARNRYFRRKLMEEYDFRCAFTGRKFQSPADPDVFGLDAAHVVPVSALGSDHPANGLLLTKELHWSFDCGLVGVAPERTVWVPACVQRIPGNEFLRDLHGKPIRESTDATMRVLEEALDWHRSNILLDW